MLKKGEIVTSEIHTTRNGRAHNDNVGCKYWTKTKQTEMQGDVTGCAKWKTVVFDFGNKIYMLET